MKVTETLVVSLRGLSPPQRLLLVNTSERKKRKAGALERENGSAGYDGFSLFPASARFYPARLWEASAEDRA